MSNTDPSNPQASGGTPQPPSYGPPTPPPPPPGADSGLPSYGQMASMPPAGYTPPPPPTRPASLDMAVKLMQAGGALAVLSLLTVFLFRDSLREAAEQTVQEQGLDASQIDTFVTIGIVTGVFFGLLGALLWFWMASANGKGKSWARITASVFYAISLVSFIFSMGQPQGMISRLLTILSLAIGTGAMVLMYRKESSEYYAAMSRVG